MGYYKSNDIQNRQYAIKIGLLTLYLKYKGVLRTTVYRIWVATIGITVLLRKERKSLNKSKWLERENISHLTSFKYFNYLKLWITWNIYTLFKNKCIISEKNNIELFQI